MNNSNYTVLVLNSELDDPIYYHEILKNSLQIIAVDGGANQVMKLGFTPQIIIGDLDSIDKETYQIFQKKGSEFIIYPSEKDQTDMELALEYIISNDINNIYVIGWYGGRFDHFLSNILLLSKYDFEVKDIKLISKNHEVFILKNKSHIKLKSNNKKYLSLIPISDVCHNLTIKGLKYELEDENLERGSTLCISNEFIEDQEAEIFLDKGIMFVVTSSV